MGKQKSLGEVAILWTIIVFLAFRAVTLVWAYLGVKFLSPGTVFLGGGTDVYRQAPLFWGWANFDGVHYLSIAAHGYYQFEQAFFPLYPLLIKAVSFLSPLTPLLSGLFISHLFLFGSLVILMDLAGSRSDFRWVPILLVTFPAAFFFLSVYTESLFLFLLLLTFWLAKRNQYPAAALTAGAASLTRIVGVFLLPALLWHLWRESDIKARPRQYLLVTVLAPLGLLVYMVCLWRLLGDPLYFFHVQPRFGAARSGSEIIFLPQVVWRYLKILATVSPSAFAFWRALLEMTSTGFVLWLIYFVRRRLPVSWLIFMVGVVVLPSLTGTFSSMPRYVLPAVALAALAPLPKWLRWGWVIVFVPIQALVTAFFIRGYFVG
jgi:hypothetical protein